MSSDLVERLQITVRQPNESASNLIDRWRKDRADALARIEALEAENARLREALEPFAKAADNFDEFKINDDAEWFAYSGIQRATGSVGAITVADLRAARRAREGGNNA